jgi:hypothetical protein
MITFIGTMIAKVACCEEFSLLRRMLCPAVATCMATTMDTLVGYLHVHEQHTKVTHSSTLTGIARGLSSLSGGLRRLRGCVPAWLLTYELAHVCLNRPATFLPRSFFLFRAAQFLLCSRPAFALREGSAEYACLHACLPACRPGCVLAYASVRLSVHLSVSLFICRSICLAPTKL